MRLTKTMGACLLVLTAIGCSTDASGNLYLFNTDCLEAKTAGAAIERGPGSISASSINVNIKEGCEHKLTSFTYSVFQDANKNGKNDPGEELFGNTWSGNSTSASVTGGNASFNNGGDGGAIRWESTVTTSNGESQSSRGRL